MLKRIRLSDSSGVVSTPGLPQELVTGTGVAPRPRLRVDVGQTSFFEGREFRTFKEWSVPITAAYVVRAEVPMDIILWELGVVLEEGAVRIETVAGGTPSGSFAEVLPVFPANTMANRPAPAYVPTVVLSAGGGHADGTVLDVIRAKTSGNSNFASSVGAQAGAERGVGTGVYYFRITLTGAIGVFKARWEEVLPASPIIVTY